MSEDLTRMLEGLKRGLQVLLDPSDARVDQTPREVILEYGKMTVARFLNEQPARYRTPVVLVPPLMVKPYIFDLHPHRSLARFLMARGYTVYLVDFGVPDEEDRHLSFDDYVLRFLPAATEAIGRQVSLLGYCVGGLFSLLYGASEGREHTRNLVLLATPVDYGKMGLISLITQKAHREIDYLVERLGNVPGAVPALGMQLVNPISTLLRYADLFTRAFDREYVESWKSLRMWMREFIPGPADAWREFFNDYVVGNHLLTGEARVGGQPVDLKRLSCPVLAVAGQRDPIATVESAQAILDLVGSTDRTFEAAPGGHIGVVAGGRAPRTSWKQIAEWLESRS